MYVADVVVNQALLAHLSQLLTGLRKSSEIS